MNFVLHIYNYKNLVSRIQSHDTLVFSAFPLVSQGLPVDQVGVAVQLGSSALSLSFDFFAFFTLVSSCMSDGSGVPPPSEEVDVFERAE